MLQLGDAAHLLSIDPGESSGWALYAQLRPGRWGLLRSGRLRHPDPERIRGVLGSLVGGEDGVDWARTIAVVEGQYHDRRGASLEHVASLMITRRQWEVQLREVGATVPRPVNPSWVLAVTRASPEADVRGTPATRRLAWVARRCYPGLAEGWQADETAAVLLGAYYLREHGQAVAQRVPAVPPAEEVDRG